MQSCPHCGSPDIVNVEIGETEADCIYECESCGDDFPGDEMVGGAWRRRQTVALTTPPP